MPFRRTFAALIAFSVCAAAGSAQPGQWKTLTRSPHGRNSIAFDTAKVEAATEAGVFTASIRRLIEHNAQDASYGTIEGQKYDARVERWRVNCNTRQMQGLGGDYYRGATRLVLKAPTPPASAAFRAPDAKDGAAEAVAKFCSSRSPKGG